MHILVVATPKFPVPPEQLGPMLEGAIAWHGRYQDNLKSFGTFPGGGGFGVVDVPDIETFNQMMLEMPFMPVSNHQIFLFQPGTAGLEQARTALQAMAP